MRSHVLHPSLLHQHRFENRGGGLRLSLQAIRVNGLAVDVQGHFYLRASQQILHRLRVGLAEAKAQLATLVSRVNQQDTIIIEIHIRMAKLDRVDELVASAKFIEEAIGQMVPRTKQEARWQMIKQRFSPLESDVKNIQDHADKA